MVEKVKYEAPKRLMDTRTGQVYIKAVPEIKDVVYNQDKGTTTVLWSDHTKTTVKCAPTDVWDSEIGVVYAIVKKVYENMNQKDFNKTIRKAVYKGKIHQVRAARDSVLKRYKDLITEYEEKTR